VGRLTETCIFCGATPLTREHLWPDWLRRQVQIREGFTHRIEQESDGVETRDRTFTTPPFNQVVKAVCAGCNGGWMSGLESTAKPILQQLIYAKGAVLSVEDQRTLASWAFLKACVFDRLHPEEPAIPAEHLSRLFTYRQAPATGVAIWLGTYEAHDIGHYAYQALRIGHADLPEPDSPNIYIVTITIGALIVQVAASLVPGLSVDDLDLPSELHVLKIWPSRPDQARFVQDTVMDHPTLVGFTKMLYNVMGRLTGGAPPAR
jgi:hypothetical protein